MTNLSHGDVKAFAQAIFQALDNVPFFFERMRLFDVDLKRQHSDDRTRHPLIIAIACARERQSPDWRVCLPLEPVSSSAASRRYPFRRLLLHPKPMEEDVKRTGKQRRTQKYAHR